MALELPPAPKVLAVLGSLLGRDVPLAPGDPAGDILTEGYSALCLDDDGHPAAALSADLRAAAFLGGTLMMLPSGRLEDSVDAGELDEIVVDALSEVFNNLTVPFNAVPGNSHVASKPASATTQLLGSDDGAWIANASKRLDLSGTVLGGAGHLVLWAR